MSELGIKSHERCFGGFSRLLRSYRDRNEGVSSCKYFLIFCSELESDLFNLFFSLSGSSRLLSLGFVHSIEREAAGWANESGRRRRTSGQS